MLEEIAVLFPTSQWQESRRGALAATVAREFPSVFVTFGADDGAQPHVSYSQWMARDFDTWRFDAAVDELSTLRIADDRGERNDFPIEVLNRCQRLIGRRNVHSQGKLFDRVLQRHRALHDVSKPLVRADYNHALDVWQWTLRLDGSASLAVQIAALFHDIERLVSEPDVRVEQNAADYQQFKDAHARGGAEMTRAILAEVTAPHPGSADPLPAARGEGLHSPSPRARGEGGRRPGEGLIDRVVDLVAHHERPGDDRELRLLNDADALSFFSLNSTGYADYYGREQTRKKVAYTWNRMSGAARAKLASVHLRDDVREMLDEVTR